MADAFGTQPQFDTAEFKSSENACSFCQTALSAGYYRINGKLSCANCVQQLQNAIPRDSHAAFVRAILFGSVAAVIGMAAYAVVEITTNMTIGFLALGVGFLVAKAMMMGSGNVGGRRYQVVALLLTYAAISMAIVPVALSQMYSEAKAKKAAAAASHTSSSAPTASQPDLAPADVANTPAQSESQPAASANSQVAPKTEPRKPTQLELLKAFGALAFFGLASPILELRDPAHGAIGLIILFVGLNIAWRMTAGTRKVSIEGPY